MIVAAHDAEAPTPEGFEVEFFAPKPCDRTDIAHARPDGADSDGRTSCRIRSLRLADNHTGPGRPIALCGASFAQLHQSVQCPFLYCRLGWETPIQCLGELLVGDGCSQRLAQTANIHPSEARRER